jgi:hypothetical protein
LAALSSGGYIHISGLDQNNFFVFRVTGAPVDMTTYYKIPIAYVDGNTAFTYFASAPNMFINYSPSGTQGVQGVQGTQGVQGIQGIQGPQGIQGTIGTTGIRGGVQYTFGASTADSDPGAGNLRFNNATKASITFIYIDILDETGANMTNWYDTWDDSTSSIPGYITVITNTGSDASVFQVTGAVISAAGYYKIPVAWVSGTIPTAGSTTLLLSFNRTGDLGTQGTQGTQGISVQGIQGIQGTQGTQGISVQGVQGTQGTQGIQGTQGVQGTQGISVQGIQGRQGTTGDSGSTTTINAQTSSYTLVIGDTGKQVEMNVATANTLTVPLNSSVAFAVGAQITILQTGAGTTTISPTGGVTINYYSPSASGTRTIKGQWGAATLVKRATDTWVLIGNLT